MVRARLLFWLAGAVALFFALQYFNERFLLVFFLFYLLIPLVSLIHGLILKHFLQTDISVRSESVERGDVAEWNFNAVNRHYTQTMAFRLLMKEGSVSSRQGRIHQNDLLLPRSAKMMKIMLSSQHTGPLRCGRVRLHLQDVGGFFRFKKFDSAKTDNFPEILILPKRLPAGAADNLWSGWFDSDMITAAKSETETDEIDRMRPMQKGDRLRDIHWKLSARLGDWMVRQYEKAGEKSVRLILDLPELYFETINEESERLLSMRDVMLDTAYTATENLVSQEVSVTLKTYTPFVLEQQVEHVSEIELIRRQLAMINFQKVVSLDEMLHNEMQNYTHQVIYLLTCNIDDDTIALLRVLRNRVQGLHVEWFVDRTTDPEMLSHYVKTMDMADIDARVVDVDRVAGYEVRS